MINIDDFRKIRAEQHLIVLDTNIFLELYRQPANISMDAISALTQIINNLYIPRQVYEEYLGNYQEICGREKKKYQKVSKELTESTRKLQEDIDTRTTEYRRHNYTDITKLKIDLDEKILEIQDIVKNYEHSHKKEIQTSLNFLINDKVKEFVDCLDSNSKIESKLTFSYKLSILKEGQLRFDNLIPPGFMDCEKTGADKYGDLFVWKSIINVAKEKSSAIIFVTNDTKVDWWEKDGDSVNDLRKELLEEFKEQNPNLDIHFMTLERFFSYLFEELQIGNSKSALQLTAKDDAEKLIESQDDEIKEKVNECLMSIDLMNEIDEEFIETGDEETYWKINSVSVEKEKKTIIYFINLCVSVFVDLIYQEPGDNPFSAGKEVIDISCQTTISTEEYSSTSKIGDIKCALVDMEHIEPDLWNKIKTTYRNESANKIISYCRTIKDCDNRIVNSQNENYSNSELVQQMTKLQELAKSTKSLSDMVQKTQSLQEIARMSQSLSELANQGISLQELAKSAMPLSGISRRTKGLDEISKKRDM